MNEEFLTKGIDEWALDMADLFEKKGAIIILSDGNDFEVVGHGLSYEEIKNALSFAMFLNEKRERLDKPE